MGELGGTEFEAASGEMIDGAALGGGGEDTPPAGEEEAADIAVALVASVLEGEDQWSTSPDWGGLAGEWFGAESGGASEDVAGSSGWSIVAGGNGEVVGGLGQLGENAAASQAFEVEPPDLSSISGGGTDDGREKMRERRMVATTTAIAMLV